MERPKLDHGDSDGRYRLRNFGRGPQRVVALACDAGASIMINWELLKNPLNLVIVTMMLLIAALGGKYALQLAKGL
jgi:hypothetical protein